VTSCVTFYNLLLILSISFVCVIVYPSAPIRWLCPEGPIEQLCLFHPLQRLQTYINRISDKANVSLVCTKKQSFFVKKKIQLSWHMLAKSTIQLDGMILKLLPPIPLCLKAWYINSALLIWAMAALHLIVSPENQRCRTSLKTTFGWVELPG